MAFNNCVLFHMQVVSLYKKLVNGEKKLMGAKNMLDH